MLSELRDGLNSAYRQLRELLTTFRLKMDGRHFSRAMADTVDEFRQRIGHEVRMEGRLGPCTLGPNQQIHALQILREALSNVARHAQARNTIVELRCMDGVVELTVEDDGMGVHIDAGPDQRVHHGLAIMRERARSLGGDLTLESPGGGSGTRVRLRFRLDAAGRENGSGVVGEQPT